MHDHILMIKLLQYKTLVLYLFSYRKAKIIKKSAFLFWLLNMAIRGEHVLRLELRKSFKFWVAVTT